MQAATEVSVHVYGYILSQSLQNPDRLKKNYRPLRDSEDVLHVANYLERAYLIVIYTKELNC